MVRPAARNETYRWFGHSFLSDLSAFTIPCVLSASAQKTHLPLSGRSLTAAAMLPADLRGRGQLFREELERLCFETGTPPA